MAPAVPSTSNISLTPGTAFITRKSSSLTRCNILQKCNKHTVPLQKYVLPMSTSIRLFPQFRIRYGLQPRLKTSLLSATGTDVTFEEAESHSAEEVETPLPAGEGSEQIQSDANPFPAQSKRTRPGRKSEMPPVKNEELIPGASFTGKVRSIQPFGAFVDFGAFTDGLVHVSRLSDSFVKDVGSIVSVGQEVTVRLVEANMETGRISLTMRDSDDPNKPQQQKDGPGPVGSDKSRPPRRSTQKSFESRKSSKFVKGQELEGTVKNLTRSGAFISLPEGEEGFLPSSEEDNEGFENIMGGSSLQVGDEVSVRVLRINRGQVTLTMKKEDSGELDQKLTQGVVHTATNPFVLAFRSNQDISAFLDEREEGASEISNEKAEEADSGIKVVDDALPETTDEADDQQSIVSDSSEDFGGPIQNFVEEREVESAENFEGETEVNSPANSSTSSEVVEASTEGAAEEDNNVLETVDAQTQISHVEDEVPAATENQTLEPSPVENGSLTSIDGQDIPPNPNIISNDNQIAGDTVDEHADNVLENEQERPLALEAESSSTPDVQVEVVEPDSQGNGSLAKSSGQDTAPTDEQTQTRAAVSPALVKQLREETGAGMMDCKKALSESGGDILKAQEYLRKKGLSSADKKASRATAEGRIGSYIHDSRIGVLIEVNCETDFVSRGDIFKELVEDLAMQVAACPQVQYLVPEDVPQEIVNKEREIEMQKEDLLSKPEQIRSKIVDGRIRKRLEELALLEQSYIKSDKVLVKDWVKQTIATIGENIKVSRFVRYNLGEGLEKKSQDFAAEVAAQTAAKSAPATGKENPAAAKAEVTVEKPPAVTVSAAVVKQLREETGAGMMDCKKALSETGGDLEKAQEYLRKKGLSTADKKSSRLAAEGRIGAYIHDSRIGTLVEVNCETDFVGRSEKFKELVDDIAMQVVACPQVQYVSVEDIPETIINKEKELEMQREDLQSKPENIREKIVQGRISKRLGELALLEQPFIKDDSIMVKDLVKQTVAALGENIKVRRFVRFTLGEGSNTTVENEA